MGQEQPVVARPPPSDREGEERDREDYSVDGHRYARERTRIGAVLDRLAALYDAAHYGAAGQFRNRQIGGDPQSDHVQRRQDERWVDAPDPPPQRAFGHRSE